NIAPRNAGDGYAFIVDQWGTATRADGEELPLPLQMTVATGAADLTDPGFCDTIERRFDRAVSRPGEWLYQWEPDSQALRITHADKTSLEARRKRNERKFSDDVRAAVQRAGKDPIVASVTEWVDDDSDQPKQVEIDFGTLPLGERTTR